MVQCVLMMVEEFTEGQKSNGCVYHRLSTFKCSGARSSADQIKIGGIMAKYLLLNRDKDAFDKVIEVIENE